MSEPRKSGKRLRKNRQASGSQVRRVIDKHRPWGPNLGLAQLWVITATAYAIAAGIPRVAVFRRDTQECLWNGGLKGTNWDLYDFVVNGSKVEPDDCFGVQEGDGGRLWCKMMRCERGMARCLVQRMVMRGLSPDGAKSLLKELRIT